MNRREYLKFAGTLAGTALIPDWTSAQSLDHPSAREYYLLRKYHVQSGPGAAVTGSYLAKALAPALIRLGIGPIGAFSLSYGPETPTTYLLIPSKELKTLATLDLILAEDPTFMTEAAAFWNAPAATPPFDRVESSLSVAFEGFPKLVPPAREPRILQLRTYESPTYASHVRKVEMFHRGEFNIFTESGAHGVFYADNLIGTRLPSLTYMLAHRDLASMDANWKAFGAHPAWQKLSHDLRYASEAIVSHVDNLVLNPLPFSQI